VPVAVGLSLRLVLSFGPHQLADVLFQKGVEDLQSDTNGKRQQPGSGIDRDLLERHRHLLRQAHPGPEPEP